jgi:hypothetical protein
MCTETTTHLPLAPAASRLSNSRRPASGYHHCVDFQKEEEERRDVCVGLGTYPEQCRVRFFESSEERGEEVVGGVDWGDGFGLVGSAGE